MKKMIDNQDQDSPPDYRFLSLAKAYTEAARNAADVLASRETPPSWEEAMVVMFLSAHAWELFLKGAISYYEPFPQNHDLVTLSKAFRDLYDKDLHPPAWPFCPEYIGLTDAKPPSESWPSMVFRYPVDKSGAEWPGIRAFFAADYVVELDGWLNYFASFEEIRTAQLVARYFTNLEAESNSQDPIT